MRELLQTILNRFKVNRRGNTVRFMFSAVASLALVLAAATITSKDVSYVRLESSNSVIEEGSSFYMNVYAYAHVPVNAVDITLKFDPSRVDVLGVDKGQSVLTIWTEEPIIQNDKVILRGGTFRKGFLREHLIATVNLRAKSTGQSSFSASDITLLAGDGNGTKVTTAEANNSKVNLYIYDENTDPKGIAVSVEVRVMTDIDGDGKVTLSDISAFMAAWNSKNVRYDFNNDGKMTFKDFSIILADFFFK